MVTNQDIQKERYKLPADWRGEAMTKIRELIKQADAEILEEVKWKTASNPGGVLVWYREGMICTGEIYKQHIRMTFAKGQELKEFDPKGFLSAYRAILFHEGDQIDERAFVELIRKAVKLNGNNKGKLS